MNPIFVALACAGLAVVSTLVLKFVSKAVPIVVIGLPVILAGLGAIGAITLLGAFGVSGAILGGVGLLSAAVSGYAGYGLAKKYFYEGMRG